MNLHEAIAIEETPEGLEVRPAQAQEDTSLIELIPLKGMLGINGDSAQERTQLKAVWEYFGADAQGVGDALYKIKQTELRMREPKLGESRLGKLYNYVRLKSQMKDFEAELEAL